VSDACSVRLSKELMPQQFLISSALAYMFLIVSLSTKKKKDIRNYSAILSSAQFH
jgi:hypothetical protein